MTELGWDIPGVPRDVRLDVDGPSAADGPASPAGVPGSRKPRAGGPAAGRSSRPKFSASALAGSSAGAFARLNGSGPAAESVPSAQTAAQLPSIAPDSRTVQSASPSSPSYASAPGSTGPSASESTGPSAWSSASESTGPSASSSASESTGPS